jgi:glyoxylase-like metal-dependent hydrolase (beta-lactamase superfamily II)
MPASIEIHTIVSMPFAENTYVLWRAQRRDCVVVDPGLDPESILDFLAANQLEVKAILNTHGHGDHIAGNEAMKQAFPAAPLLIGYGDAPMLTDPVLNLSLGFGWDVVSPAADRLLHEGETFDFAGLAFDVLEIPGHSPGHIVFVHRSAPMVVLGGDVLFRGSIGRTDLPGGDHELLIQGIRQKLFALPNDTVVYSGHGPVTTIGHERRTNPFVGL